jgi:hypothetical protein
MQASVGLWAYRADFADRLDFRNWGNSGLGDIAEVALVKPISDIRLS